MILVYWQGFNQQTFTVHLFMILFDENGNATPYTLIPLTLFELRVDFVAAFTESTTRLFLYDHFVHYVTNLSSLLDQSVQHWLGGSFVSNKLNPNDIDCVNLISFSHRLDDAIDQLMPYLLIGGSRDTYHVDGHLIAVYPETDERYDSITLPPITYWQTFFMKDRQNNPRGIIEINNDD